MTHAQVADRRRRIAEVLQNTPGVVLFADLTTQFGLSEMTIRRDLDALVENGLAVKVPNGAVSALSRSFEPPFEQRAKSAPEAKAAIGAAAARLVRANETVMIDVGTTALEVARALHGVRGLTVVTASLPVVRELVNDPDVEIMLTGGKVRPGELSLIGNRAEDAFREWNCDVAFIGVAGVDERGLTEYDPSDASVKRAAIASATRTVVVADSSKLKQIYFSTVAPLSSVNTLVTDALTDGAQEYIRLLIDAGLDVIVAPARPDDRAGKSA